MENELIEYVFKYSNWINTHYMPNIILISGFYKSDIDIVLHKDGSIGNYREFSEFVTGKIAGGVVKAGGWKYYGFVIFTGDVLSFPEWKIIDWMVDPEDTLNFKTEDDDWYAINEKTSWGPVINND